MPLALQQQLGELADGNFVERGVNVLAFGLPGTGKTHALCAVGHRLVESGRSVLFAPAYRLVQDLLAAKRDLSLLTPTPHCLTQIVTLRKWLPQLKCYRKLGRQPRGRRHPLPAYPVLGRAPSPRTAEARR